MYTIAFIGPSGTGKSYRSVTIANELKAEAIIDDGLLISKNKVLAGKSAKREPTKIAAVKRALFTDEKHIQAVKDAIAKNSIKSIMVLGTSLKMAERIVNQLNIAPIKKVVYIEEVATADEIEEARYMRKMQGKHVIPVPVPEIKRDFSGYFLHPLHQIKRSFGKNQASSEDKSIIRPTFSYMGEYTISDTVVSNIAAYEAMKIDGVSKVNSVFVNSCDDGVEITIAMSVKYGSIVQNVALRVQKEILKSIDYHMSVNVKKVDIFIKKIILE